MYRKRPSALESLAARSGVKSERVGQDADRGAPRAKRSRHALLEERVEGRLVVVRQEDDDVSPADLDDLVDDRLEELLAHHLALPRIDGDRAERAAVVADRAGLERDEEQVRPPGLRVDVVDQEPRGAQVLQDPGVDAGRQTLPHARERAEAVAVLRERLAGHRVVEDRAPVVEVGRNGLRLQDGGLTPGRDRKTRLDFAFGHRIGRRVILTVGHVGFTFTRSRSSFRYRKKEPRRAGALSKAMETVSVREPGRPSLNEDAVGADLVAR